MVHCLSPQLIVLIGTKQSKFNRPTTSTHYIHPSHTSHAHHRRQSRTSTYEPSVFFCISMLARAVGGTVETEMKALLDQMFSAGLSPELTLALKILAREIPNLHRDIQGEQND